MCDILDGGVKYFGINMLMLRDCEHYKDNWAFEAVPLTAEILKKCGFVKDGDFDNHSVDFYRNGQIHLQLSNYEPYETYYVWRDNIVYDLSCRTVNKQYDITISSLHQLQNLYFALTGNELVVNL